MGAFKQDEQDLGIIWICGVKESSPDFAVVTEDSEQELAGVSPTVSAGKCWGRGPGCSP